jgi:hypothetical protein
MSERIHSDFLKAFVEYGSCGEAPLKMLFWTGIATIAGALRRRVWIDQPHYQWTPNFYVILVAPPGVIAKSTTASIGMNLLREVDGVKFGPDVVTWQALVETMGNATELALNPATGEYLPMSALTISSSEFGTFLDPSDRGMVDALVSLWDGQKGVFSKITKSNGSDAVENPWLNIIACTTPGWIAGNFPEYMVGGGFTSRCVFVYAEKKRQFVAYPDEFIDEGFQQKRTDLIHDLEMISTMIGEYVLLPETRDWGRDWYDRHNANRPENLDNDRFGGYLARKQTHVHKLAMVLAAAQSNHLQITPEHLQAADAMITVLEQDMPRVFSTIGQTDKTRGMAEIVDLVSRFGKIEQTALYRKMFRTMDHKDFAIALNSGVAAGFLHLEQRGREVFIHTSQRSPS